LFNKFSQLKIISRFSKYKKLVGNMKDFLVCLLQFNELKDKFQVKLKKILRKLLIIWQKNPEPGHPQSHSKFSRHLKTKNVRITLNHLNQDQLWFTTSIKRIKNLIQSKLKKTFVRKTIKSTKYFKTHQNHFNFNFLKKCLTNHRL
jgi:hypothetical protein